jgi:hypothetical protein
MNPTFITLLTKAGWRETNESVERRAEWAQQDPDAYVRPFVEYTKTFSIDGTAIPIDANFSSRFNRGRPYYNDMPVEALYTARMEGIETPTYCVDDRHKIICYFDQAGQLAAVEASIYLHPLHRQLTHLLHDQEIDLETEAKKILDTIH